MNRKTTIIQGDRGSGKSTKLVNWLLKGNAVDEYPGWSRVIICPNIQNIRTLTEMVKKATQPLLDNFKVAMHPADDAKAQRELRAIHDIRKCVWSVQEFQRNQHGGFFEVEYAIDDFDSFLSYLLHANYMPSILTGTHFDVEVLHGGIGEDS